MEFNRQHSLNFINLCTEKFKNLFKGFYLLLFNPVYSCLFLFRVLFPFYNQYLAKPHNTK